MDSLEELRKKKLEELQQRQQQQANDELQAQQELTQLESVVKRLMTKEALSRYGNIKAANSERATQVLLILGQLLQSGRVQVVDDQLLQQVLMQITPKRDFKITRK